MSKHIQAALIVRTNSVLETLYPYRLLLYNTFMFSVSHPFKRSLAIVQSFLLSGLIVFVVEPAIILNIVKLFIQHTLVLRILASVLFCAKVVLVSGLLGVLVEIVSGQEDILKGGRFRHNILLFWKKYLFLQAVVFGAHFLLFMFMGKNVVPVTLLSAHVNLLLLYIMAMWIIKEKYFKPDGVKVRRAFLEIPSGLTLFFLFLGYIFLAHFSKYFFFSSQFLSRLADIISSYLYVLFFVYISTLIIDAHPEISRKFEAEKELILINPQWGSIIHGMSSLSCKMYPLLFIILKALTPSTYRVREFNRCLWNKRYVRGNCLVAITCFTSNSAIAYQIARDFKKRGAKVVMGGPHVTFMPQEALEFCDSVVIGEVETVWKKIVEDYEKGTLQREYHKTPDVDTYQEIMSAKLLTSPKILKDCLETNRGCKFNCDFCTIPQLHGKDGGKKPIEDVVALIRKIRREMPRTPVVEFLDNNIYADADRAKEFFKAIKPLGLRWVNSCSIDIANDPEALKLAKESGAKCFLIGYEVDQTSPQVKKGGKLAMARNYLELTKRIKKAGINIKAHYIFGFESDSWMSYLRVWFFALKIFPIISVVSLLTPFPGTKVYDDMVKTDRLSNLNWRNYSGQSLVFDHPKMNNFLLHKGYAFYYVFFYLTTCAFGICCLVFLILF